jgi:hypothetical protein
MQWRETLHMHRHIAADIIGPWFVVTEMQPSRILERMVELEASGLKVRAGMLQLKLAFVAKVNSAAALCHEHQPLFRTADCVYGSVVFVLLF